MNDKDSKAPTLRQTLMSVLASFAGVQSRANRERDFSHGKPLHFIALAIALTLGLVLMVVLIVKLVMRTAVT